MDETPELLFAILGRDFSSFLAKVFETVSPGDGFEPNWHLDAIAYQLERIEKGDNNRLIVTMPPRHLKSITISVAWVAWMLGRDPTLEFVCVSYSDTLAATHARDCRAVMQSPWYRRVFPKTMLSPKRTAEHDFQTTKRGGRFSTSVGGTLTGRGGDIIVIDDPIKPDEAMSETTRERVKEWYSNTLSSRLNDWNKGSIVLVMQRVHEDDLAGHLLEAGGWEHLSLPAIAETDEHIQTGEENWRHRAVGEALHPKRQSVEQLERKKSEMGSAQFSAQFQQAPVPAEGNMVKAAWLQRWRDMPEPQSGDMIVQSWDTASKDGVLNDWSVCITAMVRRQLVYVLDVYRARLLFPELHQKVIANAKQFNAKVLLIEDAASGQQLIQMLRQDQPHGVPRPNARKVDGDKRSRMSGQSSRIEAGELLLPVDAPWLDLFEREILSFPSGRHDDQVDALAQLLAWVGARNLGDHGVIVGGMLIEG